jgi:hypothetical protein
LPLTYLQPSIRNSIRTSRATLHSRHPWSSLYPDQSQSSSARLIASLNPILPLPARQGPQTISSINTCLQRCLEMPFIRLRVKLPCLHCLSFRHRIWGHLPPSIWGCIFGQFGRDDFIHAHRPRDSLAPVVFLVPISWTGAFVATTQN